MRHENSRRRRALTSASLLAAVLAVELVDELVDGTSSAALPLIRHDLALSYGQIGLLASVPVVAGSLLELPVGIMAGAGSRRRRVILAGGAVFIASLVAAAAARSLISLLIPFLVFYPASGAFVTLSQSSLMDADPARRVQHMARWNLAGSVGSLAGPVLLAAVLAAGGSWRAAYLVLGAGAVLPWLGVARARPGAGRPAAGPDAGGARNHGDRPENADDGPGGSGDGAARDGDGAARDGDGAARDGDGAAGDGDAERPGRLARARETVAAVRRDGALRLVALLEVANLLLDVLTGFVALYLVDVVHLTPAQAALGVAVRLAAGLAGDAALVGVLERAGSAAVLRWSAAAAAVLYPAFLLAPGLWLKLAALAGLSAATAPWYPVLQSELYASLPGRSGVAVSLCSAAGLIGGLSPLAVGLAAQRLGLPWALAVLGIVPVIMAGVRRRAAPPR